MKRLLLTKSFFSRPVLKVAPDLLGKYLVSQAFSVMITEVEAYDGQKDQACHGRFGLTKRNKPMFGEPGIWYVYLIYGMYWMLNVVTDSVGYPAAVLIRGVTGFNGPGKLTRHFKIDQHFNHQIIQPKTQLWLEDRFVQLDEQKILKTPRIGVNYAGEWSKKPYRFVYQPN